jgi:hypothetical protein
MTYQATLNNNYFQRYLTEQKDMSSPFKDEKKSIIRTNKIPASLRNFFKEGRSPSN